MSKEYDTKDYEYDEELEVRAPDPVIKERLLDPNYYTNYTNTNYTKHNYVNTDYVNDDLDIILKLSLEEFELAEEKRINEQIISERSEVSKKYNNIKQKLLKVQGYDTINKELYGTIISIIELYEAGFVNTYNLDETSYDNVFKLLKTIRLTKEEMDLLNVLII